MPGDLVQYHEIQLSLYQRWYRHMNNQFCIVVKHKEDPIESVDVLFPDGVIWNISPDNIKLINR